MFFILVAVPLARSLSPLPFVYIRIQLCISCTQCAHLYLNFCIYLFWFLWLFFFIHLRLPYRNRTVMSAVIVSLYELACCGQIKCTHEKTDIYIDVWNNSEQYAHQCRNKAIAFSWFCLPQNVTKYKIATIKMEMTEQRNDTFVNNRLTMLSLSTCVYVLLNMTVRICIQPLHRARGKIIYESQAEQWHINTHTNATFRKKRELKRYVLWIQIPLVKRIQFLNCHHFEYRTIYCICCHL